MKAFMRWLTKILSSVVTIALLIVLFPYISKIAARLLPDESGAAVKTSMILASKLEESSRLETMKVQDDGAINYEIKAAFLGTVAQINLTYRYEASFGIDLSKVEMRVSDTVITFLLPSPELIQDSLTPAEIYKDDFWFPGFSESDFQDLLEKEKVECRANYLCGDKLEQLWEASQKALEKTVAVWLKEIDSSIVTRFERISLTTE
jgi:hypothetical protein